MSEPTPDPADVARAVSDHMSGTWGNAEHVVPEAEVEEVNTE